MSARKSARGKVQQEPEPDGPFTLAEIEEYKEMFGIFDKDSDGKVTMHELESLVNAVGFQPGESELDTICAKIDQTGAMKFNFEEFMQIAEYLRKLVNMDELIDKSLKVLFGTDYRTARAEVLKDYLLGMGRPLTEADVKQLLWNMDPDACEWSSTIQLDVLRKIIQNQNESDE